VEVIHHFNLILPRSLQSVVVAVVDTDGKADWIARMENQVVAVVVRAKRITCQLVHSPLSLQPLRHQGL
jgi:hypothetical protein